MFKQLPMNKPNQFRADKMSAFGLLLFALGFSVVSPVSIVAQTTGSAAVFNPTLQGQSASRVEGTFANAVNYVGDVICPYGSALVQ